jgi:hypothetical protein
MTMIRTIALKVSEFVVRHVSPGCREWAEGQAHEVAFIEDDWQALWWALGSTMVLLDRREAPIGSLVSVPAEAQKIAETRWRTKIFFWTCVAQTVANGLRAFDATRHTERWGLGMVAVGWLGSGILTFVNRPSQEEPEGDDVGSSVLFYKAELERQRNRFSFPRSFVDLGILFLVCAGFMLADRGSHTNSVFSIGFTISMIVACVLAVPVMLRERRINQKRLDRLNTLLAETE